MLFSSFEFIFFFLPATVAVYYALNRLPAPLYGKLWLLSASVFFYGWWNPVYLPLLAGSICINYFIARKITMISPDTHHGLRRTVFITGVVFNIALLGYFKYANFFIDNANAIFNQHYFLATIVFPLGISFFTIQQIAFLVDSYEDLAREKSFIDYSLFVTFFPHLLAGPILHHKQMMPQFAEIKTRHFDARNFSLGLFLFSLGLFKKVVIADPLSVWIDAGYALHERMTFVDAWATSLSFVFQVYFDFSGYVDMAIGIGLMFNISLPINFDSPYKATSIINLWERWHITLSKFVTTYIYAPLVRAFPGQITFYKSMIAIFVSMFIVGLWHGPAWTYVVFGSLHGLGLVMNHNWRRLKIKIPTWLGWLGTFIFINISFSLFRATNIADAFAIIKTMFGFGKAPAGAWTNLHIINAETINQLPWLSAMDYMLASKLFAGSVLFILLCVCLFCKNSSEIQRQFQPNLRFAFWQLLLIVIPIYLMNGVTDFVYFQF